MVADFYESRFEKEVGFEMMLVLSRVQSIFKGCRDRVSLWTVDTEGLILEDAIVQLLPEKRHTLLEM